MNANPYAPPRDAVVPRIALPLPEGIRRYGLDEPGMRDLIGRRFRLGVAVSGVIAATYIGLELWLHVSDVASSAAIVVAALVATQLSAWNRTRRAVPRTIDAFEVLAAPRALRRVGLGVPAGEIVAADVVTIHEVPQGLVLLGGARRFWVPRQLVGYAELRAHVARWHAIDEAPGAWRSYWLRRKVALGPKLRAYELSRDPVLERDPDARAQLETLRVVGLAEGRVVRRRHWGVTLALWGVLILMFLAIWQFLTPPPPSHRPRPARSTPA